MSLLKNTYGVSIAFVPKVPRPSLLNKFGGSSLERKEKQEKNERTVRALIESAISKDLLDQADGMKILVKVEADPMKTLFEKPLKFGDERDYKLRSMSPRTKSKIRKKVLAFGRQSKKLTFLTLTFLNKVTDREAMKALGAFLDNVSKRSKDFQYLWVVERQGNGNLHFHLITNKFWEIDRWWNYWMEVQKKQGIIPTNSDFKPSSAFDVKVINSNNIKGVGNYITKYITKNKGDYRCMVWNCSRKISQLYTHFYSEMNFLTQLEKLEEADQLGGKITTYKQDHCEIHLIPLNNITSRLYNKIDEQNKIVWNMSPEEK